MGRDRMKKRIVCFIGAAIILCLWPVARTRADELGEIKEQLTNLEKRTSLLEEKQKAEASPTDFHVFWKEGFNLTTEDGSFKLKMGGRLQTDWFWSSEEDAIKTNVGEQEDSVEFRRARLYFSGLIYDNVEYKLQFDFAGGDADFKDAYLGLTDFPLGTLRMGHSAWRN